MAKRTKKQATPQTPAVSRPHMPGYGVPKDKKGLLPWSHAVERMTSAEHYWISTVDPDGHPHATPVDGVWLDNRLYFGGEPKTRRSRNLEVNPSVCVHLENAMDVLILHGRAEELRTGEDALFQKLVDESKKKYGFALEPEELARVRAFVFTPEWGLGWKQFPKDVTRWQF